MLPFAETVLAWRLARGMTQAELARAAGVPRPNLSAIERGQREVTLKTLRALAVALDVTPGVLVDGRTPNAARRPLTRAMLERIAGATAGNRRVGSRRVLLGGSLRGREREPFEGSQSHVATDRREAQLTRRLRETMSSRVTGKPAVRSGPGRVRAGDRAYFFLRTAESSETIASLVERTIGRLVAK